MKHFLTFIILFALLVGTVNLEAGARREKKAKKITSECGIEPKSEENVKVDNPPTVDLTLLQKDVVYPEIPRKAGVEGTVMVRALISKSGKVLKTIVANSDSKLFNKSAQKAVKKAKFTPATNNGVPVCCWITLPIKYKLK
jgi:protein TonB